MSDAQRIANEIFQFNMFDMFSDKDIIIVLKGADNLYFNDEESFITDDQYDSLRLYAWKAYPSHKYFTGVGASVRGGKIKLPYPMGSLDQIQIGEIEQWVKKWDIAYRDTAITDKLDGTSALVIYDDDGNLQIAYSRGDGVQGADITRHLQNFIPTKVSGKLVVRGEVIIPLYYWNIVKSIAETKSGKVYKNPRNCVAGLMNSKWIDATFYQYIHFVAYEILS